MQATDSFVEKLVEKVIALIEQNKAQSDLILKWDETDNTRIYDRLTKIEAVLKENSTILVAYLKEIIDPNLRTLDRKADVLEARIGQLNRLLHDIQDALPEKKPQRSKK